jgi:hypothetical protein
MEPYRRCLASLPISNIKILKHPQMKRFIKSIVLIAMLVTTNNIFGQQFNLALNYNVATPVSREFRDYISKSSVRGLQVGIMYSLKQQIRVGLQFAYNDFYHKFPRQVYKTDDGADISTVLTNTLQTSPILVKGEYTFGKGGWIKPYVGLGGGINIINYDQFVGEFEYNRTFLKAAFTGDLGLLIPLKKGSQYGFRLSSSYNLSPFNEEDIKRIDTWNLQAGVVLPLR